MKKIICALLSISLPLVLGSQAFAYKLPSQPVSSHTGMFTGYHHRNPLTGATTLSSENWAGYAVTGANGSYNSVGSSWVQPSVNCAILPTNAYSAYWVGLDGYSSPTVEQIGTEANCTNKQASYAAWYEMYPSNPYEVSVRLTVNPGDHMSAAVSYTPGTTTVVREGRGREVVTTTLASYKLTLADASSGQSFVTTLSPRQTYARSSAEVITEAPYSGGILPLADFGTVSYTASMVNGSAMGSLPNLQNIVMDNPAGMVATPSTFDSSDENFSVNWSA